MHLLHLLEEIKEDLERGSSIEEVEKKFGVVFEYETDYYHGWKYGWHAWVYKVFTKAGELLGTIIRDENEGDTDEREIGEIEWSIEY